MAKTWPPWFYELRTRVVQLQEQLRSKGVEHELLRVQLIGPIPQEDMEDFLRRFWRKEKPLGQSPVIEVLETCLRNLVADLEALTKLQAAPA